MQFRYGGLTVHYAVASLKNKESTPRLGDPVDSEPRRGASRATRFANQGKPGVAPLVKEGQHTKSDQPNQ